MRDLFVGFQVFEFATISNLQQITEVLSRFVVRLRVIRCWTKMANLLQPIRYDQLDLFSFERQATAAECYFLLNSTNPVSQHAMSS